MAGREPTQAELEAAKDEEVRAAMATKLGREASEAEVAAAKDELWQKELSASLGHRASAEEVAGPGTDQDTNADTYP